MRPSPGAPPHRHATTAQTGSGVFLTASSWTACSTALILALASLTWAAILFTHSLSRLLTLPEDSRASMFLRLNSWSSSSFIAACNIRFARTLSPTVTQGDKLWIGLDNVLDDK